MRRLNTLGKRVQWSSQADAAAFLTPVLVGLAHYNKTPSTECLLNNRNLLLGILQAGKSMIKTPGDSLSAEDHFLVHRLCLLMSSHGEVTGSSVGSLLIRALILS